jgi:hypothetical protein
MERRQHPSRSFVHDHSKFYDSARKFVCSFIVAEIKQPISNKTTKLSFNSVSQHEHLFAQNKTNLNEFQTLQGYENSAKNTPS